MGWGRVGKGEGEGGSGGAGEGTEARDCACVRIVSMINEQ